MNDAELLARLTAHVAEARALLDVAQARGLPRNAIGAMGELAMRVRYGMVPAPANQAGFDGTLNGARVSVKAREARPADSVRPWMAIDTAASVDAVCVPYQHEGGCFVIGPVPVTRLTLKDDTTRNRHAFRVGELRRAAREIGAPCDVCVASPTPNPVQ